jgi:type II secretory pathway pseudopilin PulG
LRRSFVATISVAGASARRLSRVEDNEKSFWTLQRTGTSFAPYTGVSPRSGKFCAENEGFTLTEAALALTIVGIGLAAFVMGMTKLNEHASVSRNATGAAAILQNQVDLLLSDGPFNPGKTNEDGSPQIPPELTVGTHVTNNVPIYREPTTGVIVSGTLTSTITNITQNSSGMTMTMYRADISVSYIYRGVTYSLARSTIRVTDI